MKTGVQLIQAERDRQRQIEGYTFKHDNDHAHFELVKASVCYIRHAQNMNMCVWVDRVPTDWPFDARSWKPLPKDGGKCPMINPADSLQMLVRAGALIAAEIDRLQRVEKKNL